MTPKSKIKQEKVDAVKMLSDAFKSAHSATFIDYTGMNVVAMNNLRTKLSEVGARILIAKNTLIGIAAHEAKMPEELSSVLEGQTAVIFGDNDAVAPIQAIGKFTKETELATFKAGIVEGAFQDKVGLTKISTLPNREQLYANTLGAISAPLYGIVGTLQGNLQKLVYLLDQKSKQ